MASRPSLPALVPALAAVAGLVAATLPPAAASSRSAAPGVRAGTPSPAAVARLDLGDASESLGVRPRRAVPRPAATAPPARPADARVLARVVASPPPVPGGRAPLLVGPVVAATPVGPAVPVALVGPVVPAVAVAAQVPGAAPPALASVPVPVPAAPPPAPPVPAAAPAAPAPAPAPPAPAVPALPTVPQPDASGTVPVDPVTGGWLHRRAADALALVAYPWARLGYEIVFEPARSGVRARVLLRERRVEVYVRRTDSVHQTAFDLAHELAHAFDFERGTAALRARWQQARGIDVARPWFGCNACSDLATPAGDFAESFAAWLVPGGDFKSRLGPRPDDAQRALLAELTAP